MTRAPQQLKKACTKRNQAHALADKDYLASLVRDFGNSGDLLQGQQLHCQILKSGLGNSRYLGNLLIEMYGKCGILSKAQTVFDGLQEKNIYSWTLLMTAYAQNGHLQQAKQVFDNMPSKDVVPWTTMLQAYVEAGLLQDAVICFQRMPERNVVSWTPMLVVYAQCGDFESSKQTFSVMPVRNVFSWTAMVVACAQNGSVEQAQETFNRMPKWNIVTMNAMVQGFSQNRKLDQASDIFSRMPEKNVISWTSIVTAHAHNARLDDAKKLFDSMPDRNLVSWTSIIAAFAQNGHCSQSMELFQQMDLEGEVPDEITFLNLLAGCSHIGLVKRGVNCFRSMQQDYNLVPGKEHFCCMIDVLGRSGRLNDAEELINTMPFLPDAVAWATLLGACSVYRDVERAARVADSMLDVNPGNDTPYVLLRNIFCAAGRAEDEAQVRQLMKDRAGLNTE